MGIKQNIIRLAAKSTGINEADLAFFFNEGREQAYRSNEWIFHESTPRRWAGIIMEGELELVRGLHGTSRKVGSITKGYMLSESAFLGDASHVNGAFTRNGVKVWQVSRERIDRLRETDPDVFHRIVSRIAVGINRRMRVLSDQLFENKKTDHLAANGFRLEYDSLGARDVSNDVYYGVQTQRAMENFAISGQHLNNFEHMVEALAMVKKAAAIANHELGRIDQTKMEAITRACDEILFGKLHDQFTVDMFQGGAGTSTNMNANEVIANRGLEIMGHNKGEYQFLHPNDHVNCSQSTNDAYPTAIKLAVLLSKKNLVRAMEELRNCLEHKAEEFKDVLKMGRTENQDAVPMTLGQEFSAYAVMIDSAINSIIQAADAFRDVNMGATAIGTGINSPPGYADLVVERLTEVSGFPLRRAKNLVEATQNAGIFVHMSANLKLAAVQISKICNDLRWLSSGPRCGLNEINLPSMQPGSSIMPGKVNPVIPELMNQICYQVMGYDTVVSMAAESSELELCMAEPIIAFDLLHGMMILKNGCITLVARCISGIEANRDVCQGYVQTSIGLVTALVPLIGYEQSAAIAKEALKTGGSVYDLVLNKGLLTRAQLDEMLRPENMTDPRVITGRTDAY